MYTNAMESEYWYQHCILFSIDHSSNSACCWEVVSVDCRSSSRVSAVRECYCHVSQSRVEGTYSITPNSSSSSSQ